MVWNSDFANSKEIPDISGMISGLMMHSGHTLYLIEKNEITTDEKEQNTRDYQRFRMKVPVEGETTEEAEEVQQSLHQQKPKQKNKTNNKKNKKHYKKKH